MGGENVTKIRYRALTPKEFEKYIAGFPIQESQITSLNEAFKAFDILFFKIREAFQKTLNHHIVRDCYPTFLHEGLQWLVEKAQQLESLRQSEYSPSYINEISGYLKVANSVWKQYFLTNALIHGWQICGTVLRDENRYRLPLSLFEVDDFRLHIDSAMASYRELKFNNLKYIVPDLPTYQATAASKLPPFLNKARLFKSLKRQGVPLRNDDRRSSAFFLTLYSQLPSLPIIAGQVPLHAVFRSRDYDESRRRGPQSDELVVLNAFLKLPKDRPFWSKSDIAKYISNELRNRGTPVGEKTIIKHLDAADIWENVLQTI